MNIENNKKGKTPKGIFAYHLYVILYAGFWFITPHMGWNYWDGLHTLYTVTSVASVAWIGYMMYRFLVLHDENVNVLVVFSNLILIQVLSPN